MGAVQSGNRCGQCRWHPILFVANEDVGQASAISSADGKLIGSFDVGGEPEGVNLRPDGGVVYVTSEEDDRVTVIDTADIEAGCEHSRRAAAALDRLPAG